MLALERRCEVTFPPNLEDAVAVKRVGKVRSCVLTARVAAHEHDRGGVFVLPVKLSERRSESTAQRAPLSRKIQRHAVIGQHGAAVNGGAQLVVKVGAIEDARWAVQRRLRVGGSYDEHPRRQSRVLRFSSFGEAVSLVLRSSVATRNLGRARRCGVGSRVLVAITRRDFCDLA